jgi:iron complex transport system ATP-binding protein
MISTATQTPAIEVRELSVRLGQVLALNNVSLKVPQGKWTAVIGPNGAGKSTLLRAFAGLLDTHTNVQIFGETLNKLTARDRAKRVSWLGQNERLSGDMSVYDLVMLGRLPHQSWLASPTATDHLLVQQALEEVHALSWKNRSIGELSGGEQQRVFIARALAVDADILLMDEPLNNLDPPHQSDCLRLIGRLIAQGKTVITVLHEIAFSLYSDQVIVMDAGQVVFQGLSIETQTHRRIEQVFQSRIQIHSFMNRLVVLPV